jgi:hypothetical protein
MNDFLNPEQEKENIKSLFDSILNSNVNVYENVNIYKKHFISTLKNLERGVYGEKVFEKDNESDLSPVTDPLWFSIELILSNLYGNQVANLMLWYLFDRIDINENVIPYTDDNNNIHIFEEPDDLWDYVKLLIEDY